MDSQSTSKIFPGFEGLYRIGEKPGSRAFRASLGIGRSEALDLLEGAADYSGTLSARWAMGAATPDDVVWTRLAAPILLSERVINALRAKSITGWSAIPVELHGKDGRRFPPYYFIRINGRCGPIDITRSTKIDRIYPGGIRPVLRGLYFDPSTWDGSDIFLPASTTFKIAISPVKELFEDLRVKNISFTRLDEVEQMHVDPGCSGSA